MISMPPSTTSSRTRRGEDQRGEAGRGHPIAGINTSENNKSTGSCLRAAMDRTEPPAPVAANAPPLGAYRLVSKVPKARWLKGVSEEKQADSIPPGVFDAWANATWATDPKHPGKIPDAARSQRRREDT